MTRILFAGLTTCDLVYLVDELPRPGTKGTADRGYVDVGGPAANAAITATMLGAEGVLHTVVGEGLFAGHVRSLMDRYGVATVDHDPANELPVASVWVDADGDRTILSTDNRRSEVGADAELIDLNDAAAVLLDGHYPELQLRVAEMARASGMPVVLDCGRWRDVFGDLLPTATDIIISEGFRPPDLVGASLAETAHVLSETYRPRLCAATRGSGPVLAVVGGDTVELEVPQVDVVDSTGAGDVLHGAYAHFRYAAGRSPLDALGAAVALASESCTRMGLRDLTDSGSLPSAR